MSGIRLLASLAVAVALTAAPATASAAIGAAGFFETGAFSVFANATGAGVACPADASMQVVGHPDDDLLFQSPDLLHDVQAGKCVRTVLITTGERESTNLMLTREAGLKAAYANMAGVANSWTTADAGVSGHPMPLFTLSGKPTVSLVFMRLPEGFFGGSEPGDETLKNLWQGSVSQMRAHDGTSAYTKSSLTATLTELMTAFQPDTLRTQDYVGTFGDGDHEDHYAAAYFARQAHLAYTSSHTFIGYQDYETKDRPQNVFGADLTAKTNAFDAYVEFDSAPCGSPPNCDTNDYGSWLKRQYVKAIEPGMDATAPTVQGVTPASGATGVSQGAGVTATFSEPIAPASVTGTSFVLRDGNGNAVAASVSASGSTATLQPNANLQPSTTYTATLRSGSDGIKDSSGNALASDYSWSFSTASGPSCPCSLWSPNATPQTASMNDGTPLELGVRFQSEVAGYITGIRFYKGNGNSGTHVGHLWTNSGTQLAAATFTNETATGWQQVNFANPVAISANTPYVASYFAPNGHFALDRPYFTTGRTNAPLHALADGSPAGANGIYGLGSGFPASTYQSSNYWVDVVFDPGPADTTPPTVSSVRPASGATGVSQGAGVTATFSEPIAPASVTGTSFVLRDGNGNAVAASVSASGSTATLQPNANLQPSTTYTATLRSGSDGIKDSSGNALASDYSWSFSTASGPSCPCSLWSPNATPQTASMNDGTPLELGVRFQSEVAGYITGIRFYKGNGNSGTHVGHLWTNSGTQLAAATFTNETATGWQQVNFANPVAISANTPYVASYFAPNGHFALDRPYFTTGRTNAPLHALADGSPAGANGIYGLGSGFPASTYQSSNYWVDVVFDPGPADTTPPTVSSVRPASGATGVSQGAGVTATFSEPIAPASVTGTNFVLRDGNGNAVAASVSASGSTATLQPNANLQPSTTYTATLRSGSDGIKDSSGNALASDYSWSFSTASGPSCPCSLWSPNATPQTASMNDGTPLELGVRFQSEVAGYITGIRFYKGNGNSGTHVGHLWTNSGTQLAAATFTNETATGWQQVNFANPVAISANTPYVASYFAPNGHFALDRPYFTTGRTNAPLHALADGSPAGANGIYGLGSGFPASTYQSSNYWVDVVFDPGPAE